MDNITADITGSQAASASSDGADEIRVRPLDPEPLPPLFPYTPSRERDARVTRRRQRWSQLALAAVVGALLLAVGLWATGLLDARPGVTTVAGKVVPSIVTVEVGTAASQDDDLDWIGSGSGVVLTSDGLIVTNHHVISDADTYQVIFSDGRLYRADLVGSDSRTDLAVLRIGASDLVPIEIGSSASAEIGERTIAIGSPLGLDGGPSVTAGVLSAFGRQVRTGATSDDVLFGMLQTDAPITQGSSGGALVDGDGRLLGITTAIGVSAAGAEGIGFAIPVELVTRITDEIIETGTVQHPFIGVALGRAFAENPDGSQIPAGAYVTHFPIDPSAAQEAGVLPDDVIVAYDGNPVTIPDDLISGLRAYRVGDTVTLSIKRGEEQLDIPIVLGVRPENM